LKIHWALTATLLGVLALNSCSGNQPDANALEATAASRIETIPIANSAEYQKAAKQGWANPYLILKPDGVALLDVPNHEEHLLKPDEVVASLAKLPPSAWPYGRVVAITETSAPRSAQDDVSIRQNRGIVAGTLQGLKVDMFWIPPRDKAAKVHAR
jgi:hypothetical protein